MTWEQRRKARAICDNPAFVRLIQVAIRDKRVREQLTVVLRQKPFHRKSLLHTILSDMVMRGAPATITEAMAAFTDDDVAAKTVDFLSAQN